MIRLFKRLGMIYRKMYTQPVVITMMIIVLYTMQMECCGVVHFTDYETVFTNFSVPVSCCNTTNPLASQCPDIVRNTDQMINQTGLIYSKVSASSRLTNCMHATPLYLLL